MVKKEEFKAELRKAKASLDELPGGIVAFIIGLVLAALTVTVTYINVFAGVTMFGIVAAFVVLAGAGKFDGSPLITTMTTGFIFTPIVLLLVSLVNLVIWLIAKLILLLL